MLALTLALSLVGFTAEELNAFDNTYAYEFAQHLVLKSELAAMKTQAINAGLGDEYQICLNHQELGSAYFDLTKTARNLAAQNNSESRLYEASVYLLQAQMYTCTRTTLQGNLKNRLR